MNYEKKYKDALEWARMVMSGKTEFITEEIVKVFPELKESVDERIRKTLINIIQSKERDGYMVINNVSTCAILAWLENQGDKDKLIEELGKYKVKYTQEVLSQYLEKQSEQKSTDKVKTKFKVGDFIVNDYCFGKVIEITNDAYLLDTEQSIPFSCEHNAHLWTIQDAKDGDVLVCIKNKTPFIFKGFFDKFHPKFPVAYCGICYDDSFMVNIGNGWWTDDDVCPATKEQRELLFSKMKEAGYEWDDEKKELRKLEKQAPKTKEREDEKIRMSLIQYIKNWKAQGKNRGCVFHTWTSDEKECNEILAWLEKQGEKLKWSDEDERFLNDVDFTLFQYKDMPKERYWKIIEWLKSIKQRMEE